VLALKLKFDARGRARAAIRHEGDRTALTLAARAVLLRHSVAAQEKVVVMMRWNVRVAAGGLALALLTGGAFAVGLSGPDAVKDRQAHMKGLGAASKALFEQVRSGAPDKAVVKLQADKIEAAAKALATWFPPGSGPAAGVKTGALPVIWTKADDFAAAARRLGEEAATLDAAADAGDMAAVAAQTPKVGAACKGCHDKFRAPEKT